MIHKTTDATAQDIRNRIAALVGEGTVRNLKVTASRYDKSRGHSTFSVGKTKVRIGNDVVVTGALGGMLVTLDWSSKTDEDNIAQMITRLLP